MTRPSIELNDEQLIQVEALAAYLNQEQIADYFGFSDDTFRRLCERDVKVLRAYKKGKARAIEKVATGLIQKALEGDTTSAIFYLKTQAGWAEKTSHEIKTNTPIVAIPPDTVEKYLAARERVINSDDF